MTKNLLSLAVIAANVCLAGFANASDDFYEDIPLVTSVSNFPQKISEAPTAVTIITREMIAASGVIDLHDIFHLVPGFDSYRQSGSFGGVSYGTYPNGYANNLDIKLDGLSIYEVFLNTTNWNSLGIDVEDIEFIEVVRGANPSVDGANSFTGSINIVTISPLEQTNNLVRASVGSRGERDATLQLGSFESGAAYQFTLKKRQHDGFATFEGEPVNDGLDTHSVRFRSVFSPSMFDTLEVLAGYAHTDLGMTGGGKEDTADETEPYTMVSSYLSAMWRRQDGDSQYQLRAYRTSNSVEYYDFVGPFSQVLGVPPQVFYPDFPYADFDIELDTRDENSHRVDVEFRHNLQVSPDARLGWGVGHRRDAAKSQLFFTSKEPIKENTSRAFINSEVSWGDVVTNFGAAWEETTQDESAISLRASLNYRLGEATTLRLARNNVERGPSLMAANEYRTVSYEGYVFNLDRLSHPSLGKESNRVTELGLYSILFNGAMTLDAKVFTEKGRDLIEVYTVRGTPLDFDRRIGYRDNTTYVDVKGAELATSLQRDLWKFWGHLTYREISGEALRDTNYVNGEEITAVVTDMGNAAPGWTGSLLAQRQLSDNTTLSVNYRYRDDVEYRLGGILPSASRIDATLRKSWSMGTSNVSLALMVHNLFDSQVLDYQSFNVFDRRWYVRAALDF